LIYVEKNEKQKSTVSYEAKFFKKIFSKLRSIKTDKQPSPALVSSSNPVPENNSID
jgi:hypothetical protein